MHMKHLVHYCFSRMRCLYQVLGPQTRWVNTSFATRKSYVGCTTRVVTKAEGQPYRISIGADTQPLPKGVSLSVAQQGYNVQRTLMFSPERGTEGSSTTVRLVSHCVCMSVCTRILCVCAFLCPLRASCLSISKSVRVMCAWMCMMSCGFWLSNSGLDLKGWGRVYLFA
jgi:hypothetical protein